MTNGLVTKWRVREWTTVVGKDAKRKAPPPSTVTDRPECAARSGRLQLVFQLASGYVVSAALQVALTLRTLSSSGAVHSPRAISPRLQA